MSCSLPTIFKHFNTSDINYNIYLPTVQNNIIYNTNLDAVSKQILSNDYFWEFIFIKYPINSREDIQNLIIFIEDVYKVYLFKFTHIN